MAAPAYHDPALEPVLAVHDRFDPPAGFTAEVIEGSIVLSPTPTPYHGRIFKRLLFQLEPLLPPGMDATNNITLHMPATDERYIPDLVVMADAKFQPSADWLCQAIDAELVVEIVSPSNAAVDRMLKVRGYAASGVPLYLLVDPLERFVTLFSQPTGDAYQGVHRVVLGDKLALPEPFSGVLDTGKLS